MTAATKNHHQPSTSRPPKTPTTVTTSAAAQPNQPQPLNSNPNSTTLSPFTTTPKDQALSRATHLTRVELLKRRSHNLKQLSKCYRDYYWALMEDLKIQYRDYYWKYGVSPFKEDQPPQRRPEHGGGERENGENLEIEVIDENNNYGNGNKGDFLGDLKNNHRCLFVGCKLKAMALTSFCHLHILSDSNQKLYMPCGHVIKSAQAGPITCGKPILRSTDPPLCSVHVQKAVKHLTRALKNAGLNISSSSKLAPKFHVLVAEYIRQIQAKRRAVKKDKEANAG